MSCRDYTPPEPMPPSLGAITARPADAVPYRLPPEAVRSLREAVHRQDAQRATCAQADGCPA